jgi:hypothetical protein
MQNVGIFTFRLENLHYCISNIEWFAFNLTEDTLQAAKPRVLTVLRSRAEKALPWFCEDV